MNNFTFYSPTFFAFGKDTEYDTAGYVKRFGGTKVLIHYSGGKEEDIPVLVDTLCNGNGRPGSISGFVTLNEEDCARIYSMML